MNSLNECHVLQHHLHFNSFLQHCAVHHWVFSQTQKSHSWRWNATRVCCLTAEQTSWQDTEHQLSPIDDLFTSYQLEMVSITTYKLYQLCTVILWVKPNLQTIIWHHSSPLSGRPGVLHSQQTALFICQKHVQCVSSGCFNNCSN